MKVTRQTLTGVILFFLVFGVSCGPNQEEIRISALDHFKRGNTFYNQNRLLEAAEEYKLAIARDPKQERFYYNLGIVYYSLVLYDKAIGEYWNAISINPGFPEVWYNLALALEKVNDTEKAFLAFQKYHELSRSDKRQAPQPDKPVVEKPIKSTPP